MGFNEGGFNGDGYGGFKRISLKKKKDLSPKISENISASIVVPTISLIPIVTTTESVSENVSASIGVGATFTEIFYANEYFSENISASIGVTISLSSV